jgi:hypothetical protein
MGFFSARYDLKAVRALTASAWTIYAYRRIVFVLQYRQAPSHTARSDRMLPLVRLASSIDLSAQSSAGVMTLIGSNWAMLGKYASSSDGRTRSIEEQNVLDEERQASGCTDLLYDERYGVPLGVYCNVA